MYCLRFGFFFLFSYSYGILLPYSPELGLWLCVVENGRCPPERGMHEAGGKKRGPGMKITIQTNGK